MDVVPIVLEALKLPLPAVLDGKSLTQRVRGKTPHEDRALFTIARANTERNSEPLKEYILPQGIVSSVRLMSYKLIRYPARAGGFLYELFDLLADPLEKKYIKVEEDRVLRGLDSRLNTWWLQSGRGEEPPKKAPSLFPDAERALRSLGYTQ